MFKFNLYTFKKYFNNRNDQFYNIKVNKLLDTRLEDNHSNGRN